MNTLTPANNLKSHTTHYEFATITSLRAPYDIHVCDQISDGKNTFIAYTIDRDQQGFYDNFYAVLSSTGKLVGEYTEEEGISPVLFHGPEGSIWVNMMSHASFKEKAIYLPLEGRGENFIPYKPSRLFMGKYAGRTGGLAVFYEIDSWSEEKPDKILLLEFREGDVGKINILKLRPNDNMFYIANGQIHLLTDTNGHMLHRVLDSQGVELERREFDTGSYYWIRQVISLYFRKDSLLLTDNEEGQLVLLRVTAEGEVHYKILTDIGDELENTWPPVYVAPNTFSLRFTTETGLGWMTIYKDELIEYWYGNSEGVFRNLMAPEETIKLAVKKPVIE